MDITGLVSSPRAGPHLDPLRAGAAQDPGEFIDGAGGGDHIIEYRQMFRHRAGGGDEGAAEVLAAFPGLELGLRQGGADTPAGVEAQRDVQSPGYAAGDFQRLVEAALAVAAGMKRYGNEGRGQIAAACQAFGQKIAEQTGAGVAGAEFQRSNQLPGRLLVVKQRLGGVESRWPVQALAAQPGEGQRAGAAGTGGFEPRQIGPAGGAQIQTLVAGIAAEETGRRIQTILYNTQPVVHPAELFELTA